MYVFVYTADDYLPLHLKTPYEKTVKTTNTSENVSFDAFVL